MQTQTVQHYYAPNGGDFSVDPGNMRDVHVCHTDTAAGGGEIEFQLPCVEELGRFPSATWTNLPDGSHDVLLNAYDNEELEGVLTTFRLHPGECVTLQACPEGPAGRYGWEIISFFSAFAPISASDTLASRSGYITSSGRE